MIAVACYAALDEAHQAFVPGRGASVRDVALDFSGGMAAMAVMWVWVGKRPAKIVE
jgi:VanZ family protein